MIFFAIILLIIKISTYPNISPLDYSFYLQLLNTPISLPSIRIIFVIGGTLCLLSNALFNYLFLSKSKIGLTFLTIPIIGFVLLNTPYINHIIYLYTYTTDDKFLRELLANASYYIYLYNSALLLIYPIMTIFIAAIKFFKTKIYVSRNSLIISILSILSLYIILLLLMFGRYKDLLYFDFLGFPQTISQISIDSLLPFIILIFTVLAMILLAAFKPFKYLTIKNRSTILFSNSIENENLRYFFHAQKNLLVTIQKFSSLSLTTNNINLEASLNNHQIIKNLCDRSIENITKSLNTLGKTTLSLKNTDIIELLSTTINDINFPANITIHTSFPETKVYCMVDSSAIKECFHNILSNSIEAINISSNSDGAIRINIYYDDNLVCIDFIDNGTGIDKKIIKHVFDPLFSTKSSQINYGIGLSYCKKTITLHRGYIRIKNNRDFGSTLQVVLPLAKQKGVIL